MSAIAEQGVRLRKVEDGLIQIDGRLLLLQWMIGFNLTISVAVALSLILS